MDTLRISLDPAHPDLEALQPAVEALARGEVVAIPTETVYGLIVRSDRPESVEQLYALKGRPQAHPFAYHLADAAPVRELVPWIPRRVYPLMRRFWPGPLTIVMQGEPDTVGLRVPAHTVAQALLGQLDHLVFGTSANPHGEPPAVEADAVMRYFAGRIPVVVDAGVAPLQEASTVVYVDDGRYQVLREGIITQEMVDRYLHTTVLFVCTGNTCRSPMAAALFKRNLAEALGVEPDELEQEGFHVLSAGTAARSGGEPARHSVQVMQERGLDLSHHQTQPVTADLVDRCSAIWCMGPGHARAILTWKPEAYPRVFLLNADGIPDPFGGELDEYRETADSIEAGLTDAVSFFLEEISGVGIPGLDDNEDE